MDLSLINEPASESELEFMKAYMQEDIASCMLQGKFNAREKNLLRQIHLRQRIEKKLPTYYQNLHCVLPEQLNLEQCSSEKTAAFKASLLQGERMIDLTMGMGIDTYYLQRSFKSVYAVEQDSELATLAEYNLKTVFGLDHVVVFKGQDAKEFLLQLNENVDLVMLDPARRGKGGSKVFRLQDCSPNMLELMPILQEKTRHVILKTSPVLDIHQALAELSHVKACYSIESEKECKELLFHIDFDYEGSPELIALNLDTNLTFSSTSEMESALSIPYSMPLHYIYEPGPGFLKSGLFKTIASQTGTFKLHSNSHLYTSEVLVPHFPGRSFELIDISKPSAKELKSKLPLMQANLTLRNYPGQVAELYKKLKLKEGGTDYLFATTLIHEEKVLLICKKCELYRL